MKKVKKRSILKSAGPKRQAAKPGLTTTYAAEYQDPRESVDRSLGGQSFHSKNLDMSPSGAYYVGKERDPKDLGFLVDDYFKPVLELQDGIEAIKTELVMRRDYSLPSAFNVFSDSRLANISVEQFMFGLEALGIPTTRERICLLFKRFDKTRDGTLSYEELAAALVPRDARYADELNGRQSVELFSHETMELFKSLLLRMIDSEV